jgi:hypothetical protein
MMSTLPSDLKAESFRAYPQEARAVVLKYLDVLEQLPLVVLSLLLREVITYDWRFPAERMEINGQLAYLQSLSKVKLDHVMSGFSRISIGHEFAQIDWINTPTVFNEQLSAYLWSTHQMEEFHAAADEYAAAWRASQSIDSGMTKRLGIVLVGQGVSNTSYVPFRKLTPKGVHFTQVDAADGLQVLLGAVDKRASEQPIPYAHWYIDGGGGVPVSPGVTAVSYDALSNARAALLVRMQRVIQSGSAGPEVLRTELAMMKPHDIGLDGGKDGSVLGHFQLSLFTEGSGTQIFSTTFAQWAAREALRRAQPVTLLLRFAPRQRQDPMNELLSNMHVQAALDPEGSLVDADMGAFYTWINQQRLPGADQSSFLVWFEGHNQVVAIGPSLPRGALSTEPTTLAKILTWLS